jgi:hypothetical protein
MWVVDGHLCDGGPHGPYVRAASTAAAAQSAGELSDGACALCRLWRGTAWLAGGMPPAPSGRACKNRISD